MEKPTSGLQLEMHMGLSSDILVLTILAKYSFSSRTSASGLLFLVAVCLTDFINFQRSLRSELLRVYIPLCFQIFCDVAFYSTLHYFETVYQCCVSWVMLNFVCQIFSLIDHHYYF